MRKSWKIVIIAPGDEKVPPAKYGGTELVISNLADGLVQRGHEVHLFASGDSHTVAILHPTFPKAFRTLISHTPYPEELRWFYNTVLLGRVVNEIKEIGKVDIIHNHLGWRALPFNESLNIPLVTTFHGPYDVPFTTEFLEIYPYARFISISHAQAQLNPELPFVATVYNGIRVDRFDFNGSPGEYVVFLGRISPEKGTRQAILAAQKAGVPIVLAAKVDTVDRAYFNLEVKPLIDNDQVQYVGEVDHEQKNRILRNARALLTLIQWEEPFGLVMAEAFACGTPVIAIPRGSVPEIVEDGKTGFLVKDVDEAAEAIRKVDQIDRQACRKVAEERFSTEIMVDNYVKAYQQVIEGWRK